MTACKQKEGIRMYEYESKPIENYFELKKICGRATSYFVGSFMLEMIKRRSEWENPESKNAFIADFHETYFSWDPKSNITQTRNRVNCVIRIIESHRVEDALRYVIQANDIKLGSAGAKENAKETLALIETGELSY